MKIRSRRGSSPVVSRSNCRRCSWSNERSAEVRAPRRDEVLLLGRQRRGRLAAPDRAAGRPCRRAAGRRPAGRPPSAPARRRPSPGSAARPARRVRGRRSGRQRTGRRGAPGRRGGRAGATGGTAPPRAPARPLSEAGARRGRDRPRPPTPRRSPASGPNPTTTRPGGHGASRWRVSSWRTRRSSCGLRDILVSPRIARARDRRMQGRPSAPGAATSLFVPMLQRSEQPGHVE